MSMENPRLVIDPLFYDVLSGDFWPPTKPKNKSQTLGELAVETFQSGEPLAGLEYMDRAMTRAYSPSWAPGVESTVVCRRVKNLALLSTLSLRSDEDHLSIMVVEEDAPTGESGLQLSYLLLGSTIQTAEGVIGLGNDLNRIRNVVMQGAQHFFDSYAKL